MNKIKYKSKCQEPCAKAQGVLGFLSTVKMLISMLKQGGFASILKSKYKKLRKKIFFYLALALCLFAIIYSVYLVISAPLETKTLEVKFIAGQNAGFDLNRSLLTFGRIPPGGSAVREINIENNYNFSIEIRAYASKNIAEYIDINQEFLKLTSFEKKKIPVTVSLPVNTSFGEYSGRLVFKIYKTKNR